LVDKGIEPVTARELPELSARKRGRMLRDKGAVDGRN
jgi:hypothetical protein